MTEVVLASGSPRRRELLAALVARFEVEAADIPEVLGSDPVADAVRLARAKAEAVSARFPAAVVVGADTIVHDGVRAFGKPGDPQEAARMLRELSGRSHRVVTGVAVAHDSAVRSAYGESVVELTPFSEASITAYVASGRPLDKAGAYAIQDDDVPTVASLAGCYCSVVGLPLWCLRDLLEAEGVACSDPSATYPRCAGCPDRRDTRGA